MAPQASRWGWACPDWAGRFSARRKASAPEPEAALHRCPAPVCRVAGGDLGETQFSLSRVTRAARNSTGLLRSRPRGFISPFRSQAGLGVQTSRWRPFDALRFPFSFRPFLCRFCFLFNYHRRNNWRLPSPVRESMLTCRQLGPAACRLLVFPSPNSELPRFASL
jgi:hypothetical protein